MIELLAVSHACFTSINRSVYQELGKLGYSVEIVTAAKLFMGGKWREADGPVPEDPPIHFLELTHTSPRIYRFRGLDALLREKTPRFVFMENDPVSLLAGLLGRWCRKNDAKLICLACENLHFGLKESVQRNGLRGLPAGLLKEFLFRYSRGYVDHVCTINDEGTHIFRSSGFANVSKIPLGYRPDIFFPDAKARNVIRQQLGIQTFAFAYVGRLTPEKGVDILLRSLACLKHLDWVLLLDKFEICTSPYHTSISELIENLSLEGRIIQYDATHLEIAGYMNAADSVIVPSVPTPRWKEQYGRVVPEAMACGKLVITSNSGALPELIGDAGLVVPSGDIAKLADVLEQVLTEPQSWSELPAKAVARAAAHFSLPVQTEMIDAVLRSML